MRFAIMARILKYDASGMHTFLVGLLHGIAESRTHHEIILLVDPSQSSFTGFDLQQFQVVPISPIPCTARTRLWWDHVAVGQACKRLQVDALYAPAHVRPAYAACPVTVSVFDMMYHRFPQFWAWSDQAYFRATVSALTSRATNVAALSNNTKQDIHTFLSLPEEKVTVVYPGVPEGFRPLDSHESATIRQQYQLHNPFILFVGGFHPRKNLDGLLKAFERLGNRLPHELVIIGSDRWNNETIRKSIQESSFTHRIRLLGLVPRSELPAFYNEADLFVFPSFSEGFGFPVLEALACGCPAVTTNVSSLPEVAGDAAILVSPDNIHEMADAIYQVASSADLKAILRRHALQQAQCFSWTTTAQKTLDLLQDAALHRH